MKTLALMVRWPRIAGAVVRQACAAALGLALGAAPALADYPSRPVTLVVPSPPGGSTDAIARVLADALGKRLGQSIVIENKGGGGGIVGSSYVLDKPADGHTLLLAISSKTVARALQPALAYDPIRDFTAVALVSRVPTVMVTSVAAGLPDFARLKAYIAANPGKTAWAVPGIGTAPHLTEHVLMQALGGKVNEIQYRGSAPMHVDLLAGRVDVVVDSYTALRQHIDDRKVVPVAVIGRGRIEAMSAVPTLGELGYRTFEEVLFDGWNAIDVRASTPPEVVARLSQALQDVLADRAFRERVVQLGLVPFAPMPASQAQDFVQDVSRVLSPVAASLAAAQ
ncbi:tripartite tricarboxylate transporter substrate-binding protein [Bordetella bronchiseptica]|uniref:tripartite tricarboxylate transporter substrate-binding protein n=1 Tax=Bordetella bronchiseptica TaxID=518 RepID=UPI000461A379|nr:tripartite tricarboxylate transporter substrate-binding protein [Bordetella bronchiseptica]KDD10703.1 tripartite tricarboxylate transporter family receptor [Bordetella bronchiseptica MBORD707]